MSEVVLTEVDGGVMTITLNRPEAKNAVNLAMAQGIAAALDELDGNDDIRCAILTGAGGTFCSGMDLKAFRVHVTNDKTGTHRLQVLRHQPAEATGRAGDTDDLILKHSPSGHADFLS